MVSLLNIIYPPNCISCGAETEEGSKLCHDCFGGLRLITSPFCFCCGLPFEYEEDKNSLCGNCISKTPSFNKSRSFMVYNERAGKMISSYKYSDNLHYTEFFANNLLKISKEFDIKDAIVIPVPLHRVRLLLRKYNQAGLIAKSFAKSANLKFYPRILFRKKYVKPQTSLSGKERIKNVKNIFEVRKKYQEFIKGKKIILIDDVVTTGSTIEACCKILRKYKPSEINVLTLARTLRD